MFVELDPIISIYIKDKFTFEMQNEIRHSFTLFDSFGIEAYDHPFLGLLPLQMVQDPNEMNANFMALLNDQLDYILTVHGIELIDQTDIVYKNKILQGLLDYTFALPEFREVIINFLDDNSLTIEEKLAITVSNFSDISYESLLPVIKSVDPSLIDKIYNLINNEDELLTSNPKSLLIYKKFKLFLKDLYPKINFTLADSIVLSSFPLGLHISDYLPFCHNLLFKFEDSVLALNMFSLYVISENFLKNDFINVYNFFETYYSNHEKHIDMRETFLSLVNLFNSYLNGDNNE